MDDDVCEKEYLCFRAYLVVAGYKVAHSWMNWFVHFLGLLWLICLLWKVINVERIKNFKEDIEL